jgi:hypothetical protein
LETTFVKKNYPDSTPVPLVKSDKKAVKNNSLPDIKQFFGKHSSVKISLVYSAKKTVLNKKNKVFSRVCVWSASRPIDFIVQNQKRQKFVPLIDEWAINHVLLTSFNIGGKKGALSPCAAPEITLFENNDYIDDVW